jgi:predicted ATP-dependent endonuclease of OLD family
MKIKSFLIQNYKSIKDSKECYLAENITIFAGKNGSGKSNILEALQKFSNHNFTKEDNYNYGSNSPIITVKYIMSKDEVDNIKLKYKVDIIPEITVTLDTNNNPNYVYYINENANFDKIILNNKTILKRYKKENSILEEAFPTEEDIDSALFLENVENVEIAKDFFSKEGFIDVKKLKNDMEQEILANLPTFIYQKTIENELVSIITKASIKKNDFHKDIAKLLKINDSDFDPSSDKSGRARRGTELTTELTGNFGTFYTQDRVDLKFSLDGDSITMEVVEPNKASHIENKIENKSDGLKWFIAFYAKLNVTKGKDIVILLDEPGMYLHAKACSEMLNIFAEISKSSQILMATHNPYLISADNISSVRLVLNGQESTIIENKPHKYQQDSNLDALTPILTSIGYSLTMSIHVGDQKNNLIVEGISDYYFLTGMACLLNKKLNFLIIPCIGAEKIDYISSILIGWGLNTGVLLDFDGKGIKKEEDLKVLVDFCQFVSTQKDFNIEDLFTQEDYLIKILNEEKIPQGISNSKYKKQVKIDEVLKAKEFCEKAKKNEIVLSKKSLDNFDNLFNNLIKKFLEIKK